MTKAEKDSKKARLEAIKMMPESERKELALTEAMAKYNQNREGVLKLIELCSENGGVSFVSIPDYKSDKSMNTEHANHVVNINAKYGNMKETDASRYVEVNVEAVSLEAFDYDSIILNLDEVNVGEYESPLDAFKRVVREQMPIALYELMHPETKETNEYAFNKAVKWNFSTESLYIIGQSISKKVVTEGAKKVTKSKPLTIAKELIRRSVDARTNTIVSFKLDNMNEMRLFGNTLQFGSSELVGDLQYVTEQSPKQKA